jgi:hypothetical protein
VGVGRRDPRVRPERWVPRPGSTGPFARPEGTAYATDQRAFVATANRVLREWRWADLHGVQVANDWRGVMLEAHAGDEEVDVIAIEWNRWVIGAAPNPRQVAISWLEFEGTFAAYQGRLDAWRAALPLRLSEARARAGGGRGRG